MKFFMAGEMCLWTSKKLIIVMQLQQAAEYHVEVEGGNRGMFF